MDTPANLARFGAMLRKERVRRGYTVDEVASSLKITSRVVRSIEDGDMDSMPHAVYARGFIRAYATMFDIDEEEVRLACGAWHDEEESKQPPFDRPVDRLDRLKMEEGAPQRIAPPGRSHALRSLIRFLAGAGVVVGVAWWAYAVQLHTRAMDLLTHVLESVAANRAGSSDAESGSSAAAPALSVEETPALSGAPQADRAATPEKTSARVDSEKSPSVAKNLSDVARAPLSAAPLTAEADKPASSPDEPPLLASLDEPVKTPEAPAEALVLKAAPDLENQETADPDDTEEKPVRVFTLQTESGSRSSAPGKGQQIVVTALSECWIHASADNAETRQLNLREGESIALPFDRTLQVRMGNAGGVRIRYNGLVLPAQGRVGQIKTLTFPLE